jgi:hypothetical protein
MGNPKILNLGFRLVFIFNLQVNQILYKKLYFKKTTSNWTLIGL